MTPPSKYRPMSAFDPDTACALPACIKKSEDDLSSTGAKLLIRFPCSPGSTKHCSATPLTYAYMVAGLQLHHRSLQVSADTSTARATYKLVGTGVRELRGHGCGVRVVSSATAVVVSFMAVTCEYVLVGGSERALVKRSKLEQNSRHCCDYEHPAPVQRGQLIATSVPVFSLPAFGICSYAMWF